MSRARYLRRLVFSLLAGTALPTIGWAAQPSGSAVVVRTHANASGTEGGTRILHAPGDIFQGDQIVTDSGGQAQIRFVDDTRFVVGPNSSVTIDKFIFNPDGVASKVALNAIKGTFRFISGHSPHEAYAINTPTMTLGVRGTSMGIRVLGNGQTFLSQEEGNGISCVSPAGEPSQPHTVCHDTHVGDMISAPPGGGFGTFRPGERRLVLQTIHTGLGPGLLPPFRVPGGRAGPGNPRINGSPLDEQTRSDEPPPSPPEATTPTVETVINY